MIQKGTDPNCTIFEKMKILKTTDMRTIRFCLLFAAILAVSGVQAKKKDIISKEKGSITFRVDPDLPEPTGESLSMKMNCSE